MQFEWDEGNEHHVKLHGVDRIEVEQALADPLGQLVHTDVTDGEERFRHVGATVQGRLLVVAFAMRDEVVRPVTAFDADSYTARTYREGGER